MYKHVEILLVEDNKRDADLTVRALKKRNLSNNLVWVKDGEEALEYLFARGKYKERNAEEVPKVVILDLKMPKIDGLEVLREFVRIGKLKIFRWLCLPLPVMKKISFKAMNTESTAI